MVQKKVPNKLGIQANTLKTEKRQAYSITKTSLQNHDGKGKGADLKTKKMKKSGSIKRSEAEVSLRASPKGREPPRQPGKPPPLVSPVKTPSPKKPSPCKSSPYDSPNYMKSTSSSDARKEHTKVSTSSPSKTHRERVAKSLNRVSSLKKMRTLTKVPSFKHTRTGGNKCSKVVFCENLDVEKATCSSTLKDSKFPPYLTLKPGATEAEGTSVMKVCPYSYCSLNGHHHTPAPPLKSFLSSRRRLLKTQKVIKPEILSPRKVKQSESISVMPEQDQNEEFYVKIYVPEREVVAAANEDDSCQVSESLSEEPYFIGFQEDLDQSDATISLDALLTPVQDQISSQGSFNGSDLEVGNSTCTSLYEFFGETSDMEWEEGQVSAGYLDNEGNFSVEGENGNDQDEPDFKTDENVSGYLEELIADMLPYCHDEITEWQQFSDADSATDSESNQPGEEQIEELVTVKEEDNKNSSLEDDAYLELEVKSTVEQDSFFSDPIDDIIDTETEDLDSNQDPAEIDDDEANKDSYNGGENDAGILMSERETTDNTNKDTLPKIEDLETLSAMEETSQVSFDQLEAGNDTDASLSTFADCQSPVEDVADNGSNEEQREQEANKFITARSTNPEHKTASSTVKLHSNENCVLQVQAPEVEEFSRIAESDAFPDKKSKTGQTRDGAFYQRGPGSNQEFIDGCNKLKRSTRCKVDEEIEEAKDFNPRGPNFLPIEPEPEAEKVDLRHQEMEERKNSEEWMLDFALRKTVNQLAPARKRKVALLVEAFEAVAPISKFKPHIRSNSSGFAHARPLQACS